LTTLGASPKLVDAVFEAVEEALDEAQAVVLDAPEGDDKAHKLQAANGRSGSPSRVTRIR
jgi:hypothetical protein